MKKNKFGKLLDDINRSEEIPISNEDILRITNSQTKIVLYEQLAEMRGQDFINLFTKETNYNIILLYQLDTGAGHWICIIFDIEDTQQFYHFDPYGLYPDHMLDRMYPHRELLRLYDECGASVDVSKYKFQAIANNVNTCGRWASVRSLYFYMTNDEFIDYFTKTKPSQLIKNYDHLVSVMTMVPLNYISDYHEKIDSNQKPL